MGRNIVITVAAVLAVLAATMQTLPARAQGKPPAPVIGIIDIQIILRDSKAMKAVREQIEEQRKKFQAEITEQERQLRAAGQEIEAQRTVLSPDAYGQKQRELQGRVEEIQQQVQTRRRQLDQAFSDAADTFQQTLVKLVEDIAKQRGFNMVLAKAQIVHAGPEFDITGQALKQLDQKLPTLKVNIPSN